MCHDFQRLPKTTRSISSVCKAFRGRTLHQVEPRNINTHERVSTSDEKTIERLVVDANWPRFLASNQRAADGKCSNNRFPLQQTCVTKLICIFCDDGNSYNQVDSKYERLSDIDRSPFQSGDNINQDADTQYNTTNNDRLVGYVDNKERNENQGTTTANK